MNFVDQTLDLVIIGRSILSSLANPQAELYRGLINELSHYGHRTTYLEPKQGDHWAPRDMLKSPYCEVWTYDSVDTLLNEYLPTIASADIIMLSTGIPETDRIAEWIATEASGITIYYDTDLARTMRCLGEGAGSCDTLSRETIGLFSLYLSTTGGPALERLGSEYGVEHARPLFESIDPFAFYRMDIDKTYDLGFIGSYKPERSELLDQLLLEPARTTPNRQFALAGGGYPDDMVWPDNVNYLEHLPETNRVDYYNRQQCTLILSRNDRRSLGYTPSRQLLAAAACGVPILTEDWEGLDDFFEVSRDLYCVTDHLDVLEVLYGTDESLRRKAGASAREKVLTNHTTANRAAQLLGYWEEIAD